MEVQMAENKNNPLVRAVEAYDHSILNFWKRRRIRKMLETMGKNNDMLTKLINDCGIDVTGDPLGIAFQTSLLGAVLEHIPPEVFSRIMDDAFRMWLCDCKNNKNGEICEMCIRRAAGMRTERKAGA
jgi:hypothetical protein